MNALHTTRGRIAAVAIGIPLLIGAVGQGTVVGLLARSSENHTASYEWRGGLIKLHVGDGNVIVRRGSLSTVSVAYTEHDGLQKPSVKGMVIGSGVDLTARCPVGLFDQYCSVDYSLLVPAGAHSKSRRETEG